MAIEDKIEDLGGTIAESFRSPDLLEDELVKNEVHDAEVQMEVAADVLHLIELASAQDE